MRVAIVLAAGVAVLAAAAAAFLLIPSPSPDRASIASPASESVSAPTPPSPAPVRRTAEGPAARRSAPSEATPSAPTVRPVEAAPTMATLRIESDVADAKVFIDRVGVGIAPVTVPDVAPGSHQLTVAAPGFDSYGETLELEAGPRTISVKFREVRLDARVDAVHKHGMGSCTGRLTASPHGIRYDAADGKDNFSVALADVTSFEADYLARNLLIRTRQGRTYNFTEPEGTADRLVAFHAEVDKVLKRLPQ